ncbi:adenylosuccinate lyase [Rhodoferax koreense]|uniref:Adenylosuccinate lyase n=1 Tax=Rhodoferax koreensis TaxID=1842727 RepID=A0A1P8JQ08_9BURK|nr:adenylosuccinate lyase family protein [Rhodoferax koreense]APW35836.1 adenylosuccinate lyase [Rhodoferax koreense]
MPIGMFESFMTSYCFSDDAKRIWNDSATLQAWLDVEVALARAQAELGLIPASAAEVIAAKGQASLFDRERLARDIAFSQHGLVPVLHQFEALCGEPAARYIHWGATTQNIFDTGASLQMAQTHRLLVQGLDDAIAHLSRLALAHKASPMAGRTHGQHALPTTFGLKVATWIDELDRQRQRLAERFAPSFPTLLGGAIGTYGATGAVGRAVEQRVAELLGLQANLMPSRASYDRAADYCTTLGLLAATIEKIGTSVVLLMRTEIAEVAEAFHLGKMGSSTMAQKRNPNTAMSMIGMARLLRGRVPVAIEAMVRQDEGDGSASFVTDVLLPDIGITALSLVAFLARLTQGLQADEAAMRHNLGLTNGLIAAETAMMRLGLEIGRPKAHHVLYEAAQRAQSDKVPYLTAIQEHPEFRHTPVPDNLPRWLDPETNLGESVALTEDTVRRVAQRKG